LTIPSWGHISKGKWTNNKSLLRFFSLEIFSATGMITKGISEEMGHLN